MTGILSISLQPLMSRVARYALAVLLLTSVHHIYGAYIYDTPWRSHVALVSGLATAAIIGSLLVFRRQPDGIAGNMAFWVFTAVTLVIPVVIIGIFEGGYNHVVKNALYFGGASAAVMCKFFPPPTYELPNDLFFEVTGMLQFFPAMVTGYHLYTLVQKYWRARSNADRADAAA